MHYLTLNEIRERFLAFFESRGHLRMPSFPLIPKNDNSLLLINSGMAPLKPYFTGQEIPPHVRAATCQKCVRTVDIDEVGKDARHGSFFEMLGNFSFGDYFKEEAIPWAWAFLTEEIGIPAERLYVSVYEEDGEAYRIWRETVGLPPERIVKLGKEDNFWEHGTGPCGPDSEIHYDKGEAYGCGKPGCAVGCDCDRYMEIWNLVFTQFNKREDGGYDELANKNIDTGMGLERLAIVVQGVDSIFEIDTSRAIRARVLEVIAPSAGYAVSSVNIITDHTRSVAFMAADGVLPGNEGRGYILRRLLRRAVRHGKLLGQNGPFITEVTRAVIDAYGAAYPELVEKSEYILRVLSMEESRFLETLDMGLGLLTAQIEAARQSGVTMLSGADAFKLYDTYGFPLELMAEILSDTGMSLDEDGFKIEMDAQRKRAREARGTSTYMGAAETVYHRLPPGLPCVFTGYTENASQGNITALITNDDITDSATEGQPVSVFINRTTFYAESGGQKGDAGIIQTPHAVVEIETCVKVAGGNTAHRGIVRKGTLHVGDTAEAVVNAERRMDTARNHTATHLLQKALREVLGGHVEQAGSEVSAGRLRFDFTHFAPMTGEERERVERIVNEKIMAGLPVTITETSLDEARKRGAMALFGEKYGETVRLVDMGGWSTELCGGTHLDNTLAAGTFKLIGESGVAAGVRRIEALTGTRALAYFREADARLLEAAATLKTTPDKLTERLSALLNENRQLKQELGRAKAAALQGGGKGASGASRADELLQSAEEFNGFKLVTAKLDDADADALRAFGDQMKEKLASGVMVLCGVTNGTAQFMAYATDDAVKAGAHAGLAVKEAAAVCGGGGGGRPNAAQAGGRDASRADEALAKAMETVKRQLVR